MAVAGPVLATAKGWPVLVPIREQGRRLMNAEQTEIIGTFAHLLRGPTEDGGKKRERRDNPKPLWKVDPDHMDAFYRHLRRIENGDWVDEDSGNLAHVHSAWRLLAYAAQIENQGKPGWIEL